MNAADGDLAQKRAAADSGAIALWRLRYPPVQRPGLCCHCGKPLDVPLSSINGAPSEPMGHGCIGGAFRGSSRHGGTRPGMVCDGSEFPSVISETACYAGDPVTIGSCHAFHDSTRHLQSRSCAVFFSVFSDGPVDNRGITGRGLKADIFQLSWEVAEVP
jgi:hypothetical protein